MSKSCQKSVENVFHGGKKKGTQEWWERHQHQCHSNFEGSSGAMDTAGCVAIFYRSVEQYGLRYIEFLGDGDSKAFNRVTEKEVYKDVKISKLECVGHVQKRIWDHDFDHSRNAPIRRILMMVRQLEDEGD